MSSALTVSASGSITDQLIVDAPTVCDVSTTRSCESDPQIRIALPTWIS